MAEEGNSLRDVMKDMVRGYLADYHHVAESEVDCDMVADLADVVFDVVKIEEDTQDQPYKEFEGRRNWINQTCKEVKDDSESGGQS